MVGLHAGIDYRPYDPVAETLERPLRGARFDRCSGHVDLGVGIEVRPDAVDRPLGQSPAAASADTIPSSWLVDSSPARYWSAT